MKRSARELETEVEKRRRLKRQRTEWTTGASTKAKNHAINLSLDQIGARKKYDWMNVQQALALPPSPAFTNTPNTQRGSSPVSPPTAATGAQSDPIQIPSRESSPVVISLLDTPEATPEKKEAATKTKKSSKGEMVGEPEGGDDDGDAEFLDFANEFLADLEPEDGDDGDAEFLDFANEFLADPEPENGDKDEAKDTEFLDFAEGFLADNDSDEVAVAKAAEPEEPESETEDQTLDDFLASIESDDEDEAAVAKAAEAESELELEDQSLDDFLATIESDDEDEGLNWFLECADGLLAT
ncbi:hypothetical protein F4677DRAFT_460548 [Hypoxylon crocopeplum]|nr:hypothetical protein F4677DRAFT_460548 [Hypoxylon crocopeplum]